MKMLHAPTGLLKIHGQPIEKLLHRWRFRATPKILNGINQRLTEMAQPDMVHRDARRQRITRIDNPLRKCRTPAGAFRCVRCLSRFFRFGGAFERLQRRPDKPVISSGIAHRFFSSRKFLIGLNQFLFGILPIFHHHCDFCTGNTDVGAGQVEFTTSLCSGSNQLLGIFRRRI